MEGKHNRTVIDAAGRPRRTEEMVRRRWLVGPSSVPGRRLVLTVARRERSGADRPAAGGSAGLL
jgi:hypothetical protein